MNALAPAPTADQTVFHPPQQPTFSELLTPQDVAVMLSRIFYDSLKVDWQVSPQGNSYLGFLALIPTQRLDAQQRSAVVDQFDLERALSGDPLCDYVLDLSTQIFSALGMNFGISASSPYHFATQELEDGICSVSIVLPSASISDPTVFTTASKRSQERFRAARWLATLPANLQGLCEQLIDSAGIIPRCIQTDPERTAETLVRVSLTQGASIETSEARIHCSSAEVALIIVGALTSRLVEFRILNHTTGEDFASADLSAATADTPCTIIIENISTSGFAELLGHYVTLLGRVSTANDLESGLFEGFQPLPDPTRTAQNQLDPIRRFVASLPAGSPVSHHILADKFLLLREDVGKILIVLVSEGVLYIPNPQFPFTLERSADVPGSRC